MEAFVPVLIIGFCIQLLLPLIFFFSVRYDDIPIFFRAHLNGVLWPEHWHRSDVTLIEPSELMKMSSILSRDVLHPLAVMMTFGLCSPPLACLVATVTVIRCSIWMWTMDRFVSFPTDSEEETKDRITKQKCLSALSELRFPLCEVQRNAFWSIFVISAMFILLLYWDTLDNVEWVAPLAVTFFVIALYAISKILSNTSPSGNDEMNGEVEVKTVSLNPLVVEC